VLCHLGLTFHYFGRRRSSSRNRGSVICSSTSSGDTLQILLRVSNGVTWEVPEPEDEASQLAIEESGVDEPELGNPRLAKLSQLAVEESRLDELELGNPGLDKSVLDKREAGFDHE
nr:hypothetical protein [Tanacetum cinerariifolium]